MQKIAIKFADFWPGFQENDNYFYNLLSRHFEIELSDTPDLLIFSNYGFSHLDYSCFKLQFFAESKRPDFGLADFCISFDYLTDARHLRLPLYVMYFDRQFTLQKLFEKKTAADTEAILKSKQGFCCFVTSNPKGKVRNDFFHQLSKYKKVDSGGGFLNNIGGRVENKLEFVKQYKFILAFENSSYPGYTTEKLLQPFHVNTVPVYWGNPEVAKEMNTKSFINYHDYNSFDKLAEKIIEADNNDDLYQQYLQQPLFSNWQPNEYFDESRVVVFFEKIIENLHRKPVSETILFKKKKAILELVIVQQHIRKKINTIAGKKIL